MAFPPFQNISNWPHPSDGHGKDALVGYMLVLQRTKFKTFVRLMELAQQWQVKETAQSDKPRPTGEEVDARLRSLGIDFDAIVTGWH